MNNKLTFTVEINGKKEELAVVRPNAKQMNNAQIECNKAFREALDSGAILRGKLDHVLKAQGLWDDSMQERLEKIRDRVSSGEKALASGGVKLSTAKQIAMDIRNARLDLAELLSTRTDVDTKTAESQAENRRFDYLVSCCIVYNNTGKPYFNGYTEYQEHSSEEIAVRGAKLLGSMLYGLDPDFEKKLPENEFLVKYGFMNNDLRFINKKGQLVDVDGRLIDEDGRYIDENGNYVDINGNPVTDEGKPEVEFSPFLDDETGEPVMIGVENANANNGEESSCGDVNGSSETVAKASEELVEQNSA